MGILDRMAKALNVFTAAGNVDPLGYGYGSPSFASYSPSRSPQRFTFNDKSIVTSVYTRIAIDVAGVLIKHVKLDEFERFLENADSRLNDCLLFEPNLDQGPRQFRQDIALSLFDEGCIAIVPVDTIRQETTKQIVDILSVRVGRIVNWYPKHVRVNLYNEATGNREEVTLEKRQVAIVENPLYAVMNSPNSTLQRLIRKLNLLDVVDEQTSSGKLDIIIQLPYIIKSEARRSQAEKRRTDIEMQLKGSKYGIAYTDGTEKITQLNRPSENNLLKQVEYLVNMLYDELGITAAVMNGTADEAAMLNYMDRTVEPIVEAVVEGMQRSFIGLTKYKAAERIEYFKDPFKLVPISQIAEIADKFTRNEIVSSNEIRGFIGLEPSRDPKADQLRNSNMPVSDTEPEGG